MARTERKRRKNSITHFGDVDYCWSEAHTTYGRLGVKVWICKGEIYGKVDLTPTALIKTRSKGGKFKGKRDVNYSLKNFKRCYSKRVKYRKVQKGKVNEKGIFTEDLKLHLDLSE